MKGEIAGIRGNFANRLWIYDQPTPGASRRFPRKAPVSTTRRAPSRNFPVIRALQADGLTDRA